MTFLKMTAIQRNGFNSDEPNMNKKLVQLIHSELDIKHKKSLNKTKCKNEKEFSNDIRQIKKENCTLNITWEPLRISNIQFTATAILPLPKRKT